MIHIFIMDQNKVDTTKGELIQHIKEWIKIDNEIMKLKHDIKEKNSAKVKLTDTLVNVMKINSIDCFDINGGALVYKKTKVKKPLNKKTLLSALQLYYKNDTQMAETITTHLLDNREEQIKETIRRKM